MKRGDENSRWDDEQRAYRSSIMKGRTFTEEHCRNIALAKTGKKRDPELMKQIGLKNRGKKRSEAILLKMGEAQKKVYTRLTPEEHEAYIERKADTRARKKKAKRLVK